MKIAKILIADDSPVARMMMQKSLPRDREFQIIEAADGREAAEVFRTERPDLCFMDLTMPVADGYEGVALIKEIDPDAVIVVATADRQRESERRIMELGATLLINKPPRPDSIRKVIEQIEAM